MTNSAWLDGMLNPQIKKDATLSPQGENREDHFERKVQANPWVNEILELDPVAVEAEYIAKLKQEAMILGKTAALDDVIADGVTPEETVNRDYKRDVTSLSDYALAELLAEARGHKAQNTSEMYYELKETAKKEVASSREKAEKALLEMIPENAQLDWQKAFKEYTKDATPAEPKEKDLFKSDVPEKAHDFDKPSEEKFKLPKDADKAIPGNGREADERGSVTQEAGVLKKDIVEGINKDASQIKQAWTSAKPFEVQSENARSQMFFSTKQEADVYAKELRSNGHDAKVVNHSDIEPDASLKEAHCGECPGDPGMEQKGAPEEIEKDAAQNQQVIDSFLSGQGGAKSMNLSIVKGPKGLVLVNYETPIAYRSADGQTYLNNQKYSQTTSTIQNKIRNAAQGQIKEVSPQELEQVMAAPTAAEAPSAVPSVEPMATKTSSVEKKADACPVCGGNGKDLKNGTKDNLACEACGITYASASLTATAEITNHATKDEIIKKVAELQKKAEVSSPWVVTVDPETGAECIARVDAENKTVKESEEDKKEEILK